MCEQPVLASDKPIASATDAARLLRDGILFVSLEPSIGRRILNERETL
jgi:hypothetical protein